MNDSEQKHIYGKARLLKLEKWFDFDTCIIQAKLGYFFINFLFTRNYKPNTNGQEFTGYYKL